jgi:hypothetical protein
MITNFLKLSSTEESDELTSSTGADAGEGTEKRPIDPDNGQRINAYPPPLFSGVHFPELGPLEQF